MSANTPGAIMADFITGFPNLYFYIVTLKEKPIPATLLATAMGRNKIDALHF